MNIAVNGQFAGVGISPPSGSLSYQIGNIGTPSTVPIQFGSSTLTIPNSIPGGTYTITVSYAGDNNYQASVLTIPLAIVSLTQTISFTPVANQTYGNAAVALTATSSSTLPVAFKVDSGPGSIAGSNLSLVGAGSLIIEADQAGSSIYAAATPVQQTIVVAKATTQTALIASTAATTYGASVVLTATVTGIVASAAPYGPTQTVSFYSGTTLLGTMTVNASGVATLSTTSLPAGQDSVTAQYNGDSNFVGSTSSVVTVAVATPTFTFSLPSASFTVAPGQAATSSLTLTSTNGYSGTVALSCSGLPAGATCSFSPSSVALTSGQTLSSFLVIQTVQDVAQLKPPVRARHSLASGESLAMFLLPGCWLLGGFSRGRRRSRSRASGLWLSAVLMTVSLGILLGCGSSGSASTGTPTSSNFTVTASDGKITQSATYTLVVQ